MNSGRATGHTFEFGKSIASSASGVDSMRNALPRIVDNQTRRAALDELRKREQAATPELDAIAAQRRRLPMVELPDDTLIGADGPIRLVDVFRVATARRSFTVWACRLALVGVSTQDREARSWFCRLRRRPTCRRRPGCSGSRRRIPRGRSRRKWWPLLRPARRRPPHVSSSRSRPRHHVQRPNPAYPLDGPRDDGLCCRHGGCVDRDGYLADLPAQNLPLCSS